jgi:transcription antitermination protein NusB
MVDSDNATPRRDDTDDPRRSRERAVKILFQADVRHADAAATLHALLDDPRARALIDEVDDLTDGAPLLPPIAHEPGVEVEWVRDAPATSRSSEAGKAERPRRGGGGPDRDDNLDGFTRSLVLGVYEHRAGIDELISRFARRWQISRMPVVDRTVLRIATYELLHEPTSPAVVIDEAVSLAKQLSTDDSGRYVNGVLESIRKHLRDTATTPDEARQHAVPSDSDTPDGDPADEVTPAEAGPVRADEEE